MPRQLKTLDRVFDIRNPGVVGTFQKWYRRGDAEVAQVMFGRFVAPVSGRFLRRTYRPRTATSHCKPKHTNQASHVYKRLWDLKGWTKSECDEKAAKYGLRVRQLLEALTER